MRGGGTDDGLVRLRQATQRDHVRAGAVKREIDVALGSEGLLECGLGAFRVRIMPVTDRVAVVRFDDRLQDFGGDGRVVVAGERANGRRLCGLNAKRQHLGADKIAQNGNIDVRGAVGHRS